MAELPWLAALDADDRATFYDELGTAAAAAEAMDSAAPVEQCLRAWRVTAEIQADRT